VEAGRRQGQLLIIYFHDNEVLDATLVLCGMIISDIKTLEKGIALLISSYLMFDIPVPLKYQKTISILHSLGLGTTALNFVEKVKDYIIKFRSLSDEDPES